MSVNQPLRVFPQSACCTGNNIVPKFVILFRCSFSGDKTWHVLLQGTRRCRKRNVVVLYSFCWRSMRRNGQKKYRHYTRFFSFSIIVQEASRVPRRVSVPPLSARTLIHLSKGIIDNVRAESSAHLRMYEHSRKSAFFGTIEPRWATRYTFSAAFLSCVVSRQPLARLGRVIWWTVIMFAQ